MHRTKFQLGIFLIAAALFGSAQAGQSNDHATLVAKGKKIFTGAGGCVACHAKDGAPIVQGAPNFKSAAWQRRHSDDQLSRSIREGRGTMPKHTGPESDIPALLAFVRSLAVAQTNTPR